MIDDRFKAQLSTVAKWCFFLPLFIVIAILINVLNAWTASRYLGDLIHDLSETDGFGGHFILGPLWVMYSSVVSTAGGAYAAIKFVPKGYRNKKIAAFRTVPGTKGTC